MPFDYAASDLESAIKKCGADAGRTIFCHSNLGYFGRPEGVTNSAALCELTYRAIRNAIGDTGTLVVPTFTYSFGSDKQNPVFDVAGTPSVCGMFSEYIRLRPDAVRSRDPMFSVSAAGPNAEKLTENIDAECFGEQSFWRRFLDLDGLILNLNFDAGSTFIHFVERRLGVRYRVNREFSGAIAEHGETSPARVTYFSRALDDPLASPRFEYFDKLARKAGLVRAMRVGKGAVVSITARDTVELIERVIKSEPHFLTERGVQGINA